MAPPKIATRPHFAALDGLRGVAAVSVAIYHGAERFNAEELLPRAYLAVDFFFILSGVVVAYAYEDRLKAGKIFGYFLRRAIRLYPMIVVGAILGASFYATYPDEREFVSFWVVAKLLALAILSLPLLREHLFPASHGIAPLNIPSWSLFFELFVNALYGSVARFLTTRRIATAITLAFPFECAGIYLFKGADFGVHISAFYWGFPRVIFPFFVGVLINRLMSRDDSHGVILLPSVLAVILVFTFTTPITAHARLRSLEDLVAIAVVYPLIIVFAMRIHLQGWEKSIFTSLGNLSFPIYLVHFPCLLWLDKTIRTNGILPADHPYFWVSIEIVLSGSLAISVSKFYDAPVRAWLSKWQKRLGGDGAFVSTRRLPARD
jgi:peptidoglycan/LPS O-acetylase OafA/YrhL